MRDSLGVRGVIFDCDGVLVDSEPLHDLATRKELESRRLKPDDNFFLEHIGMRVIDQMAALSLQFGLNADELYAARERRFWELAAHDLAEIPGSSSAVRTLHDAGLRIAVATSGSRRWIEHVIDHLDIRDQLSAVICGDDVVHPKPNPESYLKAAAAIALPATQCGVVEDSLRGFRSAADAGCRVVVLDRPRELASDQLGDALAVVTSLSDAVDIFLGS